MKSGTTGKMLQRSYDPGEPLSDEAVAELKALEGRPVDLSDIPASPADAKWYMPGPIAPPGNKEQITLRLDPDILAFFRQSGRRYQTRINDVLREYVAAHKAETQTGAA